MKLLILSFLCGTCFGSVIAYLLIRYRKRMRNARIALQRRIASLLVPLRYHNNSDETCFSCRELTMGVLIQRLQRYPHLLEDACAKKIKLYFVELSADKIPAEVISQEQITGHDTVGLLLLTYPDGTPCSVMDVVLWERLSDDVKGFLQEGDGAIELEP